MERMKEIKQTYETEKLLHDQQEQQEKALQLERDRNKQNYRKLLMYQLKEREEEKEKKKNEDIKLGKGLRYNHSEYVRNMNIVKNQKVKNWLTTAE